MVADLDAARDPLLHRAPVGMRETGGDVADPSGRDARDAARADELIEGDVRDRTDELEVAPSLADKLVRERERDRGLERATERDGGAVGDVVRDGIAKAHELAGGWGAQGQGPLARSAPDA